MNLKDRAQEAVLHDHPDGIITVEITTDNKYIVSDSEITAKVWKPKIDCNK